MRVGNRIRVNNGSIEELIEISPPYGLFKSKTYLTVRRLHSIKDNEIFAHYTSEQLDLFLNPPAATVTAKEDG